LRIIITIKQKVKRKKSIKCYESATIRIAFIKISALLAIGFGEAGCEIIKANLNSYTELCPMLKGVRKMAIFGFCDIRNFIEINKALEEDIMVFVNEIADIVHSCVNSFGGATNKNIGDAFLNVWKLSPSELMKKKKRKLINLTLMIS